MVRPKKRYGQHFLKEDAIARRIADSLTLHGGYRKVIEVGPGTGALTRHLLLRNDIDLTCVEVDREAATHLRESFPFLDLREEDFLQLDLDRATGGPFGLIGNFPYNISTQIVFKVLEHRKTCLEMVGMFQKEVSDRLRAAPGSRVYGITSVLVQAYYSVHQLFTVEPGSFLPPPKVRSAVIHLVRNNVARLDCDEDLFSAVVKAAFNQRRKTLNNALKAFPGFPHGVPERFGAKRAEALSVGDFVALTQAASPLASA